MASHELPPPPKKKSPTLVPTTISDLSSDILCEIFLRLPSLPSLVRAALTCSSFLDAVRSSPSFRRRFRTLHSPPLLGLFIDIYETATPAFSPVLRLSDPDLAAVIRGADFFLTRLPGDDKDAVPNWSICNCRDGCVLLVNWSTEQMAAYNPLTRALDLFPTPPEQLVDEFHVDFHILSYEEHQGSFRILCVCHEEAGACAVVFSSDAREWQIFPWYFDDQALHQSGTLVNGFVYWTDESRDHARVLDIATLEFSRVDLPLLIFEGQDAFRVGETKNGKLCMTSLVQSNLFVWLWRANDQGVERWMLDNAFPLKTIAEAANFSLEDNSALKVVAIVDGCVYLSTYHETHYDSPCWLLSFCLETSELNKLCPSRFHPGVSYPYIMAWPPSLVHNKLNPRLNGA